jgi:imidazolonepropionase-like amidohydrolase
VRRLADAGVTLLAGTDAPNPGTVFGASLHRELELLVRCGISPAQALAAATAEPARVFGLADRGRVAAGQRADLVLVSGDPLTDITATRAIERIWRGGIACDRHAFVASAAEAEQLDAFDAQLAKVVAAVRERWSN